MFTKTLGKGLVTGVAIAAGTQAYADVPAARSAAAADLGANKNMAAGFLFPVPTLTVSTEKTADKQVYYYPYYPVYAPYYAPVYAPYYAPAVAPGGFIFPSCGVGVAPFAGLTALAIGAMGFHSRRKRSNPA